MYNNQSDSSSTNGSESSEKTSFSRTVEHIINGKPGKMFVGGLSSYATANDLRFYFSQFGSIEDSMVMRDAKTQSSRCFGFVVFHDPAVIDVICSMDHYMGGKKIDPQPAVRKISPARSVHNVDKKLFIGGVPQHITDDDLREYFSAKFGKVEDVALKIDFGNKSHRGFGFITFYDSAVSDLVCSTRYHRIKGKTIETKPAHKKEFANYTPTGLPCAMFAPFLPMPAYPPMQEQPISDLPPFSSPPVMSRMMQRILNKYRVSPAC